MVLMRRWPRSEQRSTSGRWQLALVGAGVVVAAWSCGGCGNGNGIGGVGETSERAVTHSSRQPAKDSGVATDGPLAPGPAGRVGPDAEDRPATGATMLLWWGGGNMFGRDQFTIDAHRDARFEYRDRAGKVTRGGPVRLSAAEMSALEKVLVTNHACSLVSAPDYVPVPEETRTTLKLALGGMSCVVSLYAREWDSQPAAAPIAKALEALSVRAQRTRP